MALPATRLDYRIELSNVDRGVERQEGVIVARHPSETHAHATLRMLAWCLLSEERLAFGPGLSSPDSADLWAHDLQNTLVTWIECGHTTADKLRGVQRHNPGVAVHVVTGDRREAEALVAALVETKLPRGARPVTVWLLDAPLVAELAARDDRRQRWRVTVVGDHLYVEADGKNLDGAVTRLDECAT